MRHFFAVVCALSLTFLSPKEAAADDVGHNVSLTFSPVHLFLPVVEVTGEFRLPLDFSLAAIGGFGAIEGITVWEAGAQARYYLIGSFEHGMPIGVEALYAGGSAAEAGVTATANGIAVGPFVGYKLATDIGFTFDAGVGFQYFTVTAHASNSEASATVSDNKIIPLINLNIGWSF